MKNVPAPEGAANVPKMKPQFKIAVISCLVIFGAVFAVISRFERISHVIAETGGALGKIAGIVQRYERSVAPIRNIGELMVALQSSGEDISPCIIRDGAVLDPWQKELIFDFEGGEAEVTPFVSTQAHFGNGYVSTHCGYGRQQSR